VRKLNLARQNAHVVFNATITRELHSGEKCCSTVCCTGVDYAERGIRVTVTRIPSRKYYTRSTPVLVVDMHDNREITT
jgi:hypothetical protein